MSESKRHRILVSCRTRGAWLFAVLCLLVFHAHQAVASRNINAGGVFTQKVDAAATLVLGDFTISVWYNQLGSTTLNALWCVDGGAGGNTYNQISSPTQTFVFAFTGAAPGIFNLTCSDNVAFCKSGWNHALVTRSGSTVHVWENGVQDGTGFAYSSISFTATLERVGNCGGTLSTAAFIGKVSKFSIWNVALTPNQIQTLYKTCSPYKVGVQPVFYEPLTGTFSPEPDLSGGKSNGTVTGATADEEPPCGPDVR